MAHKCHATGCEVEVAPSVWGCAHHWFMVPKQIRDRVWRHYRPGQERDWKPSRTYLLAAREAVVVVAAKEDRKPDTRVYDAFLKEIG